MCPFAQKRLSAAAPLLINASCGEVLDKNLGGHHGTAVFGGLHADVKVVEVKGGKGGGIKADALKQ